jgi:DNA-directed RNA polymerase specialized sigma24 family protein
MTFEEFTVERLPAVMRFAGVLTGDRGLAEDVVQEVLIRAHGRWRKIGLLDRPELYVRKMVVNQFLSWRRRSWRLVPSGAGIDVDDRRIPDHA